MPMPEYGRYVQDMVNHCVSIENREDRQACAETIIDIMANMQEGLSKAEDFEAGLWDHLAYMSGYKLDIDYPVEINRMNEEGEKPDLVPYPTHNIRQRHYGQLLEQALTTLKEMPEGEERDELLADVANRMKQSLYDWNRDLMDDQKIADDIARYTDERVHLPEGFVFGNVNTALQVGGSQKKKKKK